jgi:hypothetical protein
MENEQNDENLVSDFSVLKEGLFKTWIRTHMIGCPPPSEYEGFQMSVRPRSGMNLKYPKVISVFAEKNPKHPTACCGTVRFASVNEVKDFVRNNPEAVWSVKDQNGDNVPLSSSRLRGVLSL